LEALSGAVTTVPTASSSYALTRSGLAGVVSHASPGVVGIRRLLLRCRPFICPFERILELMPKHASFLDVGCGMGLMGVLLAHVKHARRVVGVDISHEAIAVASSAVLPDTVEGVFSAVVPEAPLPKEPFDAVVCVDVLHHVPVPSQRAFVQRLANVDFSDAIYFKDLSPRPFWKSWANRVHDLLISRQSVNLAEEGEVKRWLEEEGLDVSGPHRLDTLWYSHYLLIARRRPSSRTFSA
jgi:SAM-dependent methyltransferase